MMNEAFAPQHTLTFHDETLSFGSESDAASTLIANTNKLLQTVGIGGKEILTMKELIRVAPSMFVAVFESFFHTRIEGVIRNPVSKEDYEINAQLVINSLSDQINIDLTHITGKSIVSGDPQALSNLIHIFMRIISLTSHEESLSTIESISSLEEGANSPKEKDRKRSFSRRSTDSISTKDSLGDDVYQKPPPRVLLRQYSLPTRGASAGPTALKMKKQLDHERQKKQQRRVDKLFGEKETEEKKSEVRRKEKQKKIFANTMQQTITKAERHLNYENKLHKAQLRRQSHLSMRESLLRRQNLLNQYKSHQTMAWKKEEDLDREEKSFELRKNSEELILLRQIYLALFKDSVKYKVEIEKLERSNELDYIQQLQLHVDNLDQLFQDRLSIFNEEPRADDLTKKIDGMKEEVKNIVKLRQSKLTKRFQKKTNQKKHQTILRQEASKSLLAMLSAEKWADNLRVYP